MRIGTRASALALAQSGQVAAALAAANPGLEPELVPITTSGDENAAPPPTAPDDKSRFVKEIEEALLDGRVDLAVHSAKDVPAVLPQGLSIVAVPSREDPRDTLIGAGGLDGLAAGATVGTGSLRRRAQLLALRPDITVAELRGNVDTRLRRLGEGRYTAIVLAAAGLARLGLERGAPLPARTFTPAPGQGCLVLEARTGDTAAASAAAALTDRVALVALTAERALVARLDATCHTPVAAHAELDDAGTLTLHGFVGRPDGGMWVRDELTGAAADPAALGRAVAERLLSAGAEEILRELGSAPA